MLNDQLPKSLSNTMAPAILGDLIVLVIRNVESIFDSGIFGSKTLLGSQIGCNECRLS